MRLAQTKCDGCGLVVESTSTSSNPYELATQHSGWMRVELTRVVIDDGQADARKFANMSKRVRSRLDEELGAAVGGYLEVVGSELARNVEPTPRLEVNVRDYCPACAKRAVLALDQPTAKRRATR